MDEASSIKSLLRPKGFIQLGVFLVLLLTYFSSEALLRRIVYDTPLERQSGQDAEKLIQAMPPFIQSYLKAYAKRLDIQDQLKGTSDPEKRIKLMFELAAMSGSDGNADRGLMMDIVEEAPHSPDILPAWLALFKDMSDQEVLETCLQYINNCDIRRPRPKVKLWESCAQVFRDRDKKVRLAFVEAMAKRGIWEDGLENLYEELLIEREAEMDPELIAQVKLMEKKSREKTMRELKRKNR